MLDNQRSALGAEPDGVFRFLDWDREDGIRQPPSIIPVGCLGHRLGLRDATRYAFAAKWPLAIMEISMSFFVLMHRWLDRLGRIAVLACVVTGGLSLAFMLLAMGVTADGGDTFRWLRSTTHQNSWPLALSAGAFQLFTRAFVAAVVLRLCRWVARTVLLIQSDPAIGIVTSVRQTGMTINQRPVMHIGIRLEGGRGSIVTSVTKRVDLGGMPRIGDRVRVKISRSDPTCIAYQGSA